MRLRLLAFVLLAACADRQPPAELDDAGPVSDGQSAPPTTPIVTVERITGEHRAIPGVMFGGWGPHLGHLLRVGDATYWVDDLCAPATGGDCDVNVNRRVGVFRRDTTGWTRLGVMALPGVQQNTASLAVGAHLYSYGIASGAQRIVECDFSLASSSGACSTIPIPIGAFANYVGAAVVPGGGRLVWWTNVVDGGGGSFSYLVNYGGGWNGPRTGPIGGYNDCGYAHVAFRGASAELFCQVVSGLAPNWSFATLVGSTSTTLASPVAWTNGLAPPAGDSVMSTNDLYVDPAGAAHLLARTSKGAAVYYHAPSGSAAYGPPALVLPATFRARWVAADTTLALARDVNRKRLVISTAARADLAAGAFAPSTWSETEVPLPTGFGDIVAIYPVSPAYQDGPIRDVELAVVGTGDEHVALYVRWSLPAPQPQ
ncbi:MAG: hypothetical protein H0T46_23685 [Deltaproteobacteria bacterium]|nr:hypothetical protein [Deltaproteobacteria bacterium]